MNTLYFPTQVFSESNLLGGKFLKQLSKKGKLLVRECCILMAWFPN